MEQVKSMSLAEIKAEMEMNGTAIPKRKRGRPRKVKPEDIPEPALPIRSEPVQRAAPSDNSMLTRFLNNTFMSADGTAPRERLSQPDNDECEMGDLEDELAELEIQAREELKADEREALIEELSQLVIRNPEIMKLEANATLREIKILSLDELREKLLIARIHMSSNLNNGISNVVLNFANAIVGKTLNITNELKAETESDKYLKDALQEVMGVGILTKLPPPLKLGALYGSSILSAYSKRKPQPIVVEKEELP